MKTIIALLICSLLFTTCLKEEEKFYHTIYGKVIDNETNDPIVGVYVSIEGLSEDGYTDNLGNYKIAGVVHNEKSYTIKFQHNEYGSDSKMGVKLDSIQQRIQDFKLIKIE